MQKNFFLPELFIKCDISFTSKYSEMIDIIEFWAIHIFKITFTA